MRRLTTQRIVPVILFALIFALAARIPVDTDVWWHLRSGEYTLTQGMIYRDPFSFTMTGQPWVNHSWLAQVILSLIWDGAGVLGLTVFTAGMAAAGMMFVYHACEGSPYLRAFAVVLGAAAAAVFWSPRPQMFSFLFSTILLFILLRYNRDGQGRLWVIPPLMALWGNLHAGFSIGFILLSAVIAGQIAGGLFASGVQERMTLWKRAGRLLLIAIGSAAALVINPYGLQILLVPFQTLSIGALTNFIQEWNSPNFHERQTWPFIALLIAVIGAMGASRRRSTWTEFFLIGGTTFMALQAGRNISVFAVVATPILTAHLHDILTERGWTLPAVQRVRPARGMLNLILAGVIVLASALKTVAVLDRETVDDAFAAVLPVRAVDFLRAHPQPANLFNSYNWGGYLIHALPDVPVFVDGRTDLYGDAFITQAYFEPATGADSWRDVFAQYGINSVLIEAGSGLDRVLRQQADWSLEYEDDLAVIYARRTSLDAVQHEQGD
ncbi:MAG: hypothetical protein ACUVS2_13415 [Candidatus Flexifilum sp.]